MKGYPRIWIMALAAFIFTATAPVYASNFAAMQLAAAHDQDAEQASEASDSGAATESDDEDSDQAAETTDADAENNPEDTTDETTARLIDVVEVVVQNSDDEAVEEARIELFAETDSSSFKKLTDDEGIAKFRQLPAERLDVKVTARGYRSYRGEFMPQDGDDPIVIKMQKRD